jgi:hypothetical protein
MANFTARAGRVAVRLGRNALVAMWALAALAGSAAAQTSASGPVTIGSDLSQPPDVNFDCSVIPFVNSVTGQFTPAPGGPSCSWGSPLFDPSQSSALGLDVPGDGTIYQVKLRVGASTGPMQIVILRTLFDPANVADNECCIAQATSSTFTPVPDGITTLNVSLPVAADANPQDNPDFLDQVGLSILQDGVTIPLIDETAMPVQDRPIGVYETPAMTLGASMLNSDPSGFELDMQALWYPSGRSPSTAAAAAARSIRAAFSGHARSTSLTASGPVSRSPGEPATLDTPIWAPCPQSAAAGDLCRLAAAFGVP